MKALLAIAIPLGVAPPTLPEQFSSQDAPFPFQGVAATNFIQWTADEKRLLAGSPEGDLLIFDVESGVLEQRIEGGDSFSAFAVFLPGEAHIAAGDYSGRLTIYEQASGNSLARVRGHSAEIACTACSPDGRVIATSDKDGDSVIWEWNGEALSIRHRLTNAVDDFANQIAFSPDGKFVGVCGSASREEGTGEVAVFEAATGARVMRSVTPAFANSVEFSSDGEVIYVGTATGKIRGLEVSTGGPASVPGGSGPQGIANARVVANDIALYYDDRGPAGSYAACGDGALRRVSFRGKILWSTQADRRTCYYAALSPTGKRVATSGTEGALRIYGANGDLIRSIGD